MEEDLKNQNDDVKESFIEGRDYYFENGLIVMTEDHLRRRGFCCENGCRHCPYGFIKDLEKKDR